MVIVNVAALHTQITIEIENARTRAWIEGPSMSDVQPVKHNEPSIGAGVDVEHPILVLPVQDSLTSVLSDDSDGLVDLEHPIPWHDLSASLWRDAVGRINTIRQLNKIAIFRGRQNCPEVVTWTDDPTLSDRQDDRQ